MIQKLCPKCRSVYIPHYERMCPSCQKKYAELADSVEKRRARNRKYNRESRDQRSAEFYNSKEWKLLRQDKLNKDCVCEVCKKKPAEIAHHIVPIAEDWDRRLDYSNLLSVCAGCHEEKHPERHKGGKARGKAKGTDRPDLGERK